MLKASDGAILNLLFKATSLKKINTTGNNLSEYFKDSF